MRPRCRAGWLPLPTGNAFGVRRTAAQLPQVTGPLMDADNIADTEAVLAEHELLLAERHAALLQFLVDRFHFARLPSLRRVQW